MTGTSPGPTASPATTPPASGGRWSGISSWSGRRAGPLPVFTSSVYSTGKAHSRPTTPLRLPRRPFPFSSAEWEHVRRLTADTCELSLSGDTSAFTAPGGEFLQVKGVLLRTEAQNGDGRGAPGQQPPGQAVHPGILLLERHYCRKPRREPAAPDCRDGVRDVERCGPAKSPQPIRASKLNCPPVRWGRLWTARSIGRGPQAQTCRRSGRFSRSPVTNPFSPRLPSLKRICKDGPILYKEEILW